MLLRVVHFAKSDQQHLYAIPSINFFLQDLQSCDKNLQHLKESAGTQGNYVVQKIEHFVPYDRKEIILSTESTENSVPTIRLAA